ncbi:hypothetical protein B0181_03615 [Moraxella caviae]|uniref:Uncharacterized protein n=1 Tax=Moraxella caviae TaxID=34060 RepID=A0A1T0A5X7_9GAMM|nr:hypothetical protein [Moraxella caviae]OOR91182.1 hypothetical protein B0181_03615 [Moraxella caviae]STZ13781.1 Uncharacterised protein [Moraxella caviae]VEW13015.1 Uncharacterised protein [Moraxella caviae]
MRLSHTSHLAAAAIVAAALLSACDKAPQSTEAPAAQSEQPTTTDTAPMDTHDEAHEQGSDSDDKNTPEADDTHNEAHEAEQSDDADKQNTDDEHAHAHHHDHDHSHGDHYDCKGAVPVIHLDIQEHDGEAVAHLIIDDVSYDLNTDGTNPNRFASIDDVANGKNVVLNLNGNKAAFTTPDGKTWLDCTKG